MIAVRQLKVDQDKCIGCQACSNVCPVGLITFSDKQTERTIQFARVCPEDCNRCIEACSEEAISLTTVKEAPEGFITAGFPLMQCSECGTVHATEKMVTKLRALIPALLVPEGEDWTALCLSCRQKTEAKNISGQALKFPSLPESFPV
jgi:ferredoxin